MMKHDFAFDPTYGYDRTALELVGAPAEAVDFADFWRDTFAQNQAVPLEPTLREIVSNLPRVRVFEVEFNTLGGHRIGGWLTLPRDGPVRRGVVVGHGYGGREGPDGDLPTPHAAAIFPCAPGFHRSASTTVPGAAAFHVIHGIAARETYIHRFCVTTLWSAASALQTLVPEVGPELDYMGVSFGGGIGALALPWDHRWRRAYLEVPSFGNHPLRVTLPCVGSGEAVRLYHRRRPQVLEVLRYFDAAVAARQVRVPVLCACAAFDPAVPPPGQFAVYNALAGPKRLYVRQAGHFEYPACAEDDRAIRALQAAWFGDEAVPV